MVVIILGDDMGMFGSEIRTPNLDALAKDGVRFTSFYTHALCSPTRSTLLSGMDTHLNGIGNMDEWTAAPNQRGVPGCEGFLNDRVVTLPQLLKDTGLRDEDLHGQAGQLHRREPRRRQAFLRVRRPSGSARSLPPPEGMARPARR